MPITPDQLLYPRGRVHGDLFPDKTEDELAFDIDEWIQEAYAMVRVSALEEAEQDRAVTAWAHYRAFDAASIMLAANPSSSTQSDAGSASYSKDQRDTLSRVAREARAEFELLAPLAPAEAPRTGGGTVSHNFAW